MPLRSRQLLSTAVSDQVYSPHPVAEWLKVAALQILAGTWYNRARGASHTAWGMGGSSDDDSDSVEESELGRKEHWDAVYKQELTDLQQLGQEGELW